MKENRYMPEVIKKEDQASLSNTDNPLRLNFSRKAILITTGFVIVTLVFMLGVLFSLNKNEAVETPDTQITQQNSESKTKSNQIPSVTDEAIQKVVSESNTIVVGAWSGQKSVISSTDLTSNNSTVLATLPLNIKKVNVLNSNTLSYIDQTNDQDQGAKINLYLLKEKSLKSSINASPGFRIDDYVLSPNKQYMAIWEVSFAQNSNVLKGGRSRVYTVKLSDPTVKNLIYDEIADSPVHYPRAILNIGRVFSDSFRPNDPNGGAGWAYGMGVSDFDGQNKKDIEEMAEGTYGTQPSLSPDGKYLVFAGYDGSRGDGKSVSSGYRQALLTPTTIELLDTTTLKRTKLTNILPDDIYPKAEWGATSNTIITTVISKSQKRDGLFTYDLSSKSLKRLGIPKSNSLVTSLAPDKYLLATIDESGSSIGNLGDEYLPPITKLYYFDPITNQAIVIPASDPYVQYITTLPPRYFKNVLAVTDTPGGGGNPAQPNVTIIDLYSDKPSRENLQLKTFLFKPALETKRQQQQTNPIPTPTTTIPITGPAPTRPPYTIRKTINCTSLAIEQCGFGYNSNQCIIDRRVQLRAEGKCNQSPLYLYGESGKKVNVEVLTTVYNDNPRYNNGYSITLLENGKMQIGGASYQAINYDYLSNLRRLTPPTLGTIAKKSEIEKVLRSYAKKLGLNEKETVDLVIVGQTKITSPYVFISFFDQKTSEQILPLAFAPTPDNYLNVVFYFKQLEKAPNYTPAPPQFDKPLERSGFTAVEVSEIIE